MNSRIEQISLSSGKGYIINQTIKIVIPAEAEGRAGIQGPIDPAIGGFGFPRSRE